MEPFDCHNLLKPPVNPGFYPLSKSILLGNACFPEKRRKELKRRFEETRGVFLEKMWTVKLKSPIFRKNGDFALKPRFEEKSHFSEKMSGFQKQSTFAGKNGIGQWKQGSRTAILFEKVRLCSPWSTGGSVCPSGERLFVFLA